MILEHNVEPPVKTELWPYTVKPVYNYVDKEEFEEFVDNYPTPLLVTKVGIGETYKREYYDARIYGFAFKFCVADQVVDKTGKLTPSKNWYRVLANYKEIFR